HRPRMTSRSIKRAAFLLLLCLLWVSFLAAQTPNSSRYDQSKSTNYGFVSPNTLDNSRFDDAIKNLNSPEELKLMNKTLNLGCRVGQNVKVYKAVGSWRDGAEHSVLITLTSDEKRMRYFVSRLGKYSRQKAVLYFHQQPGGKATIYILYSPG